MSSGGVSWREVIRRKHEKDTADNLSRTTEVNQEVNNDNEYMTSESNSDNDEFMRNDMGNNYVRDFQPESGSNQIIVCQIVS